MNICHVTSAHDRYDDRIFLKECKSLREAGLKVNLIVHDELENEKKEGVDIYSTGKKYCSRWKRIFGFAVAKVGIPAWIMDYGGSVSSD